MSRLRRRSFRLSLGPLSMSFSLSVSQERADKVVEGDGR